MAKSRGYTSYRGRSPFWRHLLVGVLLAIILASVGVILLQRTTLFDGWGIQRVELPQNQGGDPETPPLNVQGAASAGDAETKTPTEETDAPEDANAPEDTIPSEGAARSTADWPQMRGYRIKAMPFTRRASNSLSAIMEDNGYDTAAVTLKDEEGNVWFDSVSAVRWAAQPADSTARALESLLSSPWHTIARIACFRDQRGAYSSESRYALFSTTGGMYFDDVDGTGVPWMDPAKPAAWEYLCALAAEAAQMGFDEILLTDVAYPSTGPVGRIDYQGATAQENLTAFLAQMRTALEPYSVTLSIELPKAALTGMTDGLTLEAAAPYVDCVYAAIEPEEIAAYESRLLALGDGTALIPEVSTVPDPAPARFLYLAK